MPASNVVVTVKVEKEELEIFCAKFSRVTMELPNGERRIIFLSAESKHFKITLEK